MSMKDRHKDTEKRRTYVAKYRKEHKSQRREYIQNRIARGICIDCGHASRSARCIICLAKHHQGLTGKELQKAVKAWEKFDGRCQCCGTRIPGGTGYFCTDHDHKNKRFRGIICHNCNVALGFMGDSEQRILCLLIYLRKFLTSGNE